MQALGRHLFASAAFANQKDRPIDRRGQTQAFLKVEEDWRLANGLEVLNYRGRGERSVVACNSGTSDLRSCALFALSSQLLDKVLPKKRRCQAVNRGNNASCRHKGELAWLLHLPAMMSQLDSQMATPRQKPMVIELTERREIGRNP